MAGRSMTTMMPAPAVTNWFGDLVSHPRVVVEARSVEDIVAVLKDRGRYPSPVRAVGSNHSTAPCGTADGGTLIKMAGMNRILEITDESVTVEAGTLYIDIAKALEGKKLQLHINTEIGSLSAGSACCAGTKDASMPGEFGQVSSYVTRIRMVLPSGELFEVTEEQPELMQKVRSSYGTFGIVYEVTFRVRKLTPLAVHHETFTIEDFARKLPQLKARGESMMFYIFPFQNLITVEFRRYNKSARSKPDRSIWQMRNYLWATTGPIFCANVERDIEDLTVRYNVIDGFNALWRFKLENLIQSENTVPGDQIIRYPLVAGASKYTFSLFAFLENDYPAVLKKYCDFSRKYFKTKGYRINMLCVGYRIAQDRNALLSYSWDGDVMTIDPVSTANPGWNEFLDAYNEFCIANKGIPLMNQTLGIKRAQAQRALGDRLKLFAATRREFDPNDRLLNDYFRDLLAE
jgi:FAD/FMN-containing dehydrogenase